MKRILFVDDSELLREMYRAMMSHGGEQWEVETAGGGAEALEWMGKSPFDVVVSDLQMPGMDGAELLREVGARYPKTARIMISGLSDKEFVANSLRSTHQFIAKPATVTALRETLSRIGGLDAFLKDEKLKALAGRLETLPSFPSLYLEIMEAIESPDVSIKSISDIVKKDPGLTAKMLQVVNSSAFGLGEKVHDPMEAVRHLGMNTLRSLALSSHIFSNFAPAETNHFSADALWAHLLKCGEMARAIARAKRVSVAEMEDAYTAGILHDIGKLMLADSFPGEFQQAMALAAKGQAPLSEVEVEIFGATHAALAAYLLGLWGLPAPIVEAVAFHHTPEKSDHRDFSPLAAVHVANAFAHERANEKSSLNQNYLVKIGVADDLATWREAASGD